MKENLNKFYLSLGIFVIAFIVILLQWGFFNWKQWLDLNGWVRLLYKMDFSQYEKNYENKTNLSRQKNNVVDIVKKNIDSRISKLWVSDYSARYLVLWWEDYIEVSLWWVKNMQAAKKLIWKTVRMTFKVPFSWNITKEIKQDRKMLAENLLINIKKNNQKEIEPYLIPWAWNVNVNNVSLSWSELKNTFWESIEQSLTWGYVYPKILEKSDSFDIYSYIWENNWKYDFFRYSVNVKPAWEDAKIGWKLLNWERFEMATLEKAPSWSSAVAIHFDNQWRKMFWDLTKQYLGKQMAIFIWNKMVTAPVIQAEIYWWVAQITWNFSIKEANKLADDLNTWAMPVSLNLQQEEKVAPILGQKALQNSFLAWLLWISLIFIMFWIFYSIKYALVTLFSLIIFLVVLWWFIKLFGVVLSLAAIWAIILNIGMAVDANVIIFERVKEEMNNWAWFLNALQSGYENSKSAIRDWNLTTWIIAFLLFMIWTNIFKGFWTMMIINIFIVLVIMVPSIPWMLWLLKNK